MTERTQHEERYLQLLEKDGTKPSDGERKALFFILAHPDTFNKINGIYDFKNHWIKSDCFEKVDFSGGIRRMVQLAFNLYNGNPAPDPLEIFSGLDKHSFHICLRAIQIRFNME